MTDPGHDPPGQFLQVLPLILLVSFLLRLKTTSSIIAVWESQVEQCSYEKNSCSNCQLVVFRCHAPDLMAGYWYLCRVKAPSGIVPPPTTRTAALTVPSEVGVRRS